MKLFVALSLSFIFSSTTVLGADEDFNPYRFGCTQGIWTQRALDMNRMIVQSVKQLESLKDKNCQGIETALTGLLAAQEKSLSPADPGESLVNQSVTIPDRLAAVRTALTSPAGNDPTFRKEGTEAMVKETMKFGLLTAKSALANSASGKLSFDPQRIRVSLQMSAAILDEITSILPRFDTCLIGHADQGAALLGYVVNLAAAYASSNDRSLRMGNVINHVLRMFQDRKFTRALQALQSVEFWSSMSCMLETTADSYCNVVDNKHLLEDNQKSSENPSHIAVDHPLAGYYIMAVHLPNVLSWISKLQFGITPQWSTDALFKQQAFDNVTNFIKAVWNVIGKFNDDTQIYKFTTKDVVSKRLYLFQMLRNAVIALSTEEKQTGVNGLNFFTMNIGEKALPFYLIGRDSKVPDKVAGSSLGGSGTPWDEYIFGDGSFSNAPEFNDPDHLIIVIKKNLENIAQEGDKKASDFYRQRIIVNQANLAIEAMVDMAYTRRRSLDYIYKYLSQLEDMLLKGVKQDEYSDDAGIIAGLEDTRYRIRKILEAFTKLRAFQELKHNTDEDSKRAVAAYEELIKTVYDQLDVMKQRDSYLANALTNYVIADYSYRVRNHVGFGRYDSELLMSSGKNLLDVLNTIHGMSPSIATTDLNRAGTFNLQNLAGFEQVFRDSFVSTIDYLNLIIRGKGTTNATITKSSIGRLWVDSANPFNGVFCRENPIACTFSSLFGPAGRAFTRRMLRPDLYPFKGWDYRKIYPQHDPLGMVLGFRNQLCIQSLAFEENADLRRLCGMNPLAVLEGGYKSADPANFYLNANYEKLANLPTYFDQKDKSGRKTRVYNEEGRIQQICAYRDFNRRILVKWMTENLNEMDSIFQYK